MQTHATDFRSRSAGHRPTLWVMALLALLFGGSAMQAQLNGTRSIGGPSPDYADIPAAISALNSQGISGNVTFLIRGGTYTLSAMQTITNFSRSAGASTATVTFKPDLGASVTITGSVVSNGLFNLNGAHHIVFDGSNNGTTSRDMLIRNTYATYSSVIVMQNNADFNTVQNCQLISAGYFPSSFSVGSWSTYAYGGTIHIYGAASATAPCDDITIRNNQIGDPSVSPTYRYSIGVYAVGYGYTSTSAMNQRLKIVGNDFVNFGHASASITYPVAIGPYNMNTVVDSNEMRMTVASTNYPAHVYQAGIYRYNYYGYSPVFTARRNRIHDFGSTYSSTQYIFGILDYSYYTGNYASSYPFLHNDTATITDNEVYNIKSTTGSSVTVRMNGIYSAIQRAYANNLTVRIQRNNVHDLSTVCTTSSYNYPYINGISVNGYHPTPGASGYIYGTNVSVDISDNDIHGISSVNGYGYSSTGSFTSYGLYGLWIDNEYAQAGSGVRFSINRNRIYDFSMRADYGGYLYYVFMAGMYIRNYYTAIGSTVSMDISGNKIYDFRVPSTENHYYMTVMYGIYYDGYYSGAAVTLDSNIIYDLRSDGVKIGSGSQYFFGLYVNGYNYNYNSGSVTPSGPFLCTRNQVYNLGRSTAVSYSDTYYYYGIYLNIYGYSSTGYPGRTTLIEKNRVSRFLSPVSGGSSQYLYGLYVNTNYAGTGGVRTSFSNNMVALNTGSYTSVPTFYGAYFSNQSTNPGATTDIAYNSIYIRTSSTSTIYPCQYYCTGNGNQQVVNHKNNIYDIQTQYTYPLYWYFYQTSLSSNNNLVNVSTTNPTSYPVIYFVNPAGSGYTYQNFPAFASAQGQDQATKIGTAPFVDPAAGDLHIGCGTPFVGKAAGTPIPGITDDHDGDQRGPMPDIGADETDKLLLTYPNGGEVKATEDTVNIRFTSGKAIPVTIYLSTNNGQSWSPLATNFPAAVGANTFTIPAASFPSQSTDQALVYIAGNSGGCPLADTSNAVFRILKPTVTIVSPNGGEELVPTDTVKIEWATTTVPPTVNVQLEYSSNSGMNWTPLGAPMATPNGTTNSINWIVPDNSTPNPITTNLVRARLIGRSEADTSDRTFTIRPTPIVNLMTPAGGEIFYVGRTATITWESRSVDYMAVDYSTDGGTNWMPIAARVPAYLGQLDWVVPNTLTTNAVIRLSDAIRPRFSDRSNTFTITKDSLALLSPNGGEVYALGAPITVNWFSSNIGTVKIEFSSNGGATWTVQGSGINAGNFTYNFTPAEIPTEQGLVRITSEQNGSRVDVSDAFFQIAPAANISVYTPVAGDRLVRNSTSVITWQADGVNKVNILYSSNGGSTWSTVVNDVAGAQSSYLWTVPNQTTQQGMIEIREVGGSLRARSGVFQIIDPAAPGTITVLSPNGGESYTEGDVITVSWTATGVGPLALRYSADGGSTWKTIASGLSGSSYQWTAPAPVGSGDQYRVEVRSVTPMASDASDANFTITKRQIPSLVLLYPNGGENLTIDSTYQIRWSATNVAGDVSIEYTVDGTTWKPVGTTGASTGSYAWTIPDDPSTTAKVRLVSSTLSDTSNAVFEISRRVVLPITVLYPNGGEVIRNNDVDSVVWDAPADVSVVKLEYSTDGGSTWVVVIPSTPSVGGRNQFVWNTPNIPTLSSTSLVRVSEVLGTQTGRSDISDNAFTLLGISSVGAGAVTGGASLSAVVVPNPTAGRAELRWQQVESGEVSVRLLQPNGGVAGEYSVGHRGVGGQVYNLDASELPSGMYLYELRVGRSSTRGMVMIAR